MKRKILVLTGILFVSLACGIAAPSTPAAPAQSGVETVVAQTMQALTSAAPAATIAPVQPSGTTIAINNISFVIPTALGNGAQVEKVDAVPPSNDMPWWEIAPTYNKYHIQGYVLGKEFHDPTIYVYPANEYAQMNEDVGKTVNSLKTIIGTPGQSLPEHLPFLPTFNAAQMFYSNEQPIDFQSGKGIRYLTQYGQAPYPVNNNALFYTFQGLTNDGAYYVSAILPINAPYLSADGNPDTALPADGIPFDWNNFENTNQHFALAKQKLEATDPNTFNPTLTNLDALVQSIAVK
jgi:hypothetical protein